jgi:hypothetical protein
MRIYVASKFQNTKAVKEAYEALKADGHVITHDWTNESAEGMTGQALEDYLVLCAKKDLRGVQDGDALLLLNHQLMAGGFTEFGMAVAYGKYIVVIDGHHPDKPRNIFFHLPNIVHAKDLTDARKILLAHDHYLRTFQKGQ